MSFDFFSGWSTIFSVGRLDKRRIRTSPKFITDLLHLLSFLPSSFPAPPWILRGGLSDSALDCRGGEPDVLVGVMICSMALLAVVGVSGVFLNPPDGMRIGCKALRSSRFSDNSSSSSSSDSDNDGRGYRSSFPASTVDSVDIGGASETLEAIKLSSSMTASSTGDGGRGISQGSTGLISMSR